MTVPRFRPMGLGDIFDEAFDLYRNNFLYLLLVAAAVVVPAHLLAPLLAARYRDAPSLDQFFAAGLGAFTPPHTFTQLGPFFDGPVWFAPLYPLAAALEAVALAGACGLCYLGGTRTLRATYRVPLRRLPSVAVTLLLYMLSLALGVCVCYLGVIVPVTWFALTAQTFALEGRGLGGALGRSRRLVSGDAGRVFGCLILLSLLSSVVGLGIRLPLAYALDTAFDLTPNSTAVLSGGPSALSRQHYLIDQTCQGLADLVLTPFLFSVLTVLYYDLRVRKEAFDVDLLAGGLGYPPLATVEGYLPPSLPTMPPKVRGAAPR